MTGVCVYASGGMSVCVFGGVCVCMSDKSKITGIKREPGTGERDRAEVVPSNGLVVRCAVGVLGADDTLCTRHDDTHVGTDEIL